MNDLTFNKRLESIHMTPMKMLILFVLGVLLGIALISRGWAAQPVSTKTKHAKPKVTAKAHKTTAAPKKAAAKPKPATPAKIYAHPQGLYELRYPASWQVNGSESAMVMKSQDRNGYHGIFGIVHRPEDMPNEEAVDKEFQAPDRPNDLTRGDARIAGMHAIKVVGSGKEDPMAKMVEYYVENPNGQKFYILMMAPRSDWARYNTAFSAMLRSLSFNK